MLSFPLDAR
ncbi:hypothetical protein PENNAL_c0382G08249, partial [Penicillium nalgiovense]